MRDRNNSNLEAPWSVTGAARQFEMRSTSKHARTRLDPREMRDTGPMDSDTGAHRSVTRHDDRGCYELDVGGHTVAFADFSQHDDVITIPHIETDVRHRGNGYSSVLMDGVIDDLRRRNEQVRATCPVARAHIVANAPELLAR